MRQKEKRMHQARILAQEGLRQKEIADRLGVSARMVRYYLTAGETEVAAEHRPSKLDPFVPLLESLLEEDPFRNVVNLRKRLRSMGYDGGMTILREKSAEIRHSLIQKAVVRFETEPGRQAQVDWKEAGVWELDGVPTKVYAFVMLLGYSRRPYVWFTTSMKSPVLLACHVRAFEAFGGVPLEILYDNMKTAWLFDGQSWNVHPKLLELASNLGFTPKRCQVRRPQTKGKVERFIQTLGHQFLPWAKETGLSSLDALNEKVNRWLEEQGDEVLRELGQTRSERFETEKAHLRPFVPEAVGELRESVPVTVSREGRITFETNRYSIPAKYLGKTLTLLVDRFKGSADVMEGTSVVRPLVLARAGSRRLDDRPEDRQGLLTLWEKQNRAKPPKEPPKAIDLPPLIPRSPEYYDFVIAEGDR